jgi:ribose 5-phosphate isomerase B
MHIGIATDHGGYVLKEPILEALRNFGHEVRDFGAYSLNPGVGASFTASKVRGVRSALVHESFSAHQGVEDDDMNLLCLGGRVVGIALALEIIQIYLAAHYLKAERFERRLAKVAAMERRP